MEDVDSCAGNGDTDEQVADDCADEADTLDGAAEADADISVDEKGTADADNAENSKTGDVEDGALNEEGNDVPESASNNADEGGAEGAAHGAAAGAKAREVLGDGISGIRRRDCAGEAGSRCALEPSLSCNNFFTFSIMEFCDARIDAINASFVTTLSFNIFKEERS